MEEQQTGQYRDRGTGGSNWDVDRDSVLQLYVMSPYSLSTVSPQSFHCLPTISYRCLYSLPRFSIIFQGLPTDFSGLYRIFRSTALSICEFTMCNLSGSLPNFRSSSTYLSLPSVQELRDVGQEDNKFKFNYGDPVFSEF